MADRPGHPSSSKATSSSSEGLSSSLSAPPKTRPPTLSSDDVATTAAEPKASVADNGDNSIIDGHRDTAKNPSSDFGSLSDFMTPYLTCSRCNSVVFINVLRVRPKDALAAAKKPIAAYEQVPTCPGCGSTRYLRAGVVSFQEQIEDKKRAIREFERRRVPATALIQRIARGFLGRLAFRRRLLERERHLCKIDRAATRIQARVRGMQARRRTLVERCLVIIRRLAPSILADAISPTAHPNQQPVFWYSNASELSIFYWDYREFVWRSGGKPSLIQVEKNVMEIARRMLAREFELVSRIQARWRGITSRLVFRELKRQKGWWNSIRQSPAIKIQRLFRAHTDRKRCRALRVKNKYPQQRQVYREEMAAKADKERSRVFREKLLSKYRVQTKVENSTRMMTGHRILGRSSGNQAIDASLRPEPHREGLDATALEPETVVNLQYSLGRSANSGVSDTRNREKATLRTGAHPNAQRFAQLKQQLEAKHPHVRGPRLHILKSQLYAPASPSSSELVALAGSDSERD